MIAALEYYYPSETYLNILNLRLLFQYTALFVVLQAIFRQFMWPRDILAKQRARVLLVAAILAFPVPVTIFALNVLFGVDYFPVWINLPFLLFPLAIAYSIVKHNLF